MDLSSLTRSVFAPLGGGKAPAVQLTFNPPLPATLRSQLTHHTVVLTVTKSQGSHLTFAAPNGATYTATTSTPLPPGTRIGLSTAPAPPAPAPALPAATLPLAAKLLPALGQTSVPANAPAIHIQQPPSPAAPPFAHAIPAPLPIPLTTGGTTLQNILLTSFLAQPAAAPATPLPTLPLPPGPLPATFAQTPPAAWLGQPLTLTATQPMVPTASTQPAQLANPQRPAAPPLPLTLAAGQPLPPHQPLTATLAGPATQPTLILTQPSATALPPSLPHTPATITLPPAATATLLPGTLLSARILPPNPAQPAPSGHQPVLLASGQAATLQSSQPLPTGSIVVAEVPTIPAPAQVLRIQPSGSQTQQQNQTAAKPAPHVNPQAGTITLPEGATIQGIITGVAEDGLPLFTIQQPAVLAGHTVPLALTAPPAQGNEPTPPLTPGTQLTVRVEPGGSASIITLVLAPQTARANTLSTLGTHWHTLLQALQTLQQQAPAKAADLRTRLPHINALLPGLLSFTDALRRPADDQAAALVGRDTATLLKALGVDLAADLHHLAQLQQRTHAENGDPQWRGTLFPYVEAVGEDPRQGGFFWRRDKQDDPRGRTNTRFVVELALSAIGPVQLDGLLTYPDVWLKLRRTTPPEEGFTENLQALVTQTLQAFGLTGGIAVEVTPQFPVNPRAEMLAASPNPLPTSA